MKHIKLLALAAALVPCFSEAAVSAIAGNFATGAANAGRTNPIIFNLGAGNVVAPAGAGIVAVGFFGSTDAQISAVGNNAAAWATVAATFTQFGASATMGAGSGAAPGQPGLFNITPSANVAGTPFSGKNVYVAIGSGATLATSTQFIVFKSATTFADEPTPSVTASLTDATAGQNPTGLLLGTFGAPQVWYQTGPLGTQTLSGISAAGPIIPEPASALLGLLGLGFVVRRRR